MDDFEQKMRNTVERYEELRDNFNTLYRQVKTEELRQRFLLLEEDWP